MAVKKISVLVCDACGEQQGSADVMDELGVEITAWGYHHGGGGYGGRKTYFCLECVSTKTLGDLLQDFYEARYGNE